MEAGRWFFYFWLALVGWIVYRLVRGAGVLPARERPERIVGKRLTLREPDGLGLEPLILPAVRVNSFTDGRYNAEFETPLQYEGRPQRGVTFSARHRGHPVSQATRRSGLAVNAELTDSHRQFIANVTLG
jgi:hypothetical protein